MGSRSTQRQRERLLAAEARLYAALDLPVTTRWLELDHGPVARVRVLASGEGPPVLVVHGVGVGAAVWAPLAAELRDHHVLAVDLPGFGLSPPFDATGVDVRAHGTTVLRAILAALDLPRVAVVGNSLGGTYGLYLAAAGDPHLSHLVLLGATGVALPGTRTPPVLRVFAQPTRARVVGRLMPPVWPGLSRRMFASVVGTAAVRAVPTAMPAVVAALTNLGGPTFRSLIPELFDGPDVRPELPLTLEEFAAITVPTRFVWGRDDVFQPARDAAAAVRAVPDADLIEVAGGHHPWWDDPVRCAALVREHLAASG